MADAPSHALVDPAAPLDELPVHQRNLPGRPAEAEQADAQPNGPRFPQPRCRTGHGTIATARIGDPSRPLKFSGKPLNVKRSGT